MAQQLLGRGVASDVFDAGFIRRDVGALEVLPEPTVLSEAFRLETTADYATILLTGPWQKAVAIRRLLARRRKGQPVYYLPRGGLGRVEFTRPRDLKKIPYFFALERAFVHGATGVVYSSETERRHTIGPARRKTGEHVIPDIVAPPREQPVGDANREGPVTFAFLAEVSPRKGLLPLVEGFRAFSADKPAGAVRLIVGGRPRPGSEAYLAEAETAAAGAPVEFRGAIAHQHRDSFYGETDVMVVASSFESYGLTVIEALNEGCALVSTPQVGALEYVDSPISSRSRRATTPVRSPTPLRRLMSWSRDRLADVARRCATSRVPPSRRSTPALWTAGWRCSPPDRPHAPCGARPPDQPFRNPSIRSMARRLARTTASRVFEPLWEPRMQRGWLRSGDFIGRGSTSNTSSPAA
uniref:Glycosyltransferase family 4 protein n=1 Tax=Phenylobacterium glaciei TaxID=2803784 RepID=A0A974SAD0_9CAUL|nr:glycosyltransferase family 4 protein [Phenylobacterium glaciei]